jgi:flagellar assembly protein FliH
MSSVDLADHLAEAQAVVDQAKRKAARILDEADGQARRDRDEAFKQGYVEGQKKGYQEGKAAGYQDAHDEAAKSFQEKHGNVVTDFVRSIEAIDSMKDALRIQAERDVLDFSIDLARRLTFAFGAAHRESATENLRRALKVVGAKSDVAVRVNPADVASMQEFAGAAVERAQQSPTIRIVGDESISPGGCDVIGEDTHVDATLETQMERLISCLLGEQDRDD